MLLLTWAGTIPLKKGERTRLACSQSRLGEDINPPISSHRTVKTKRAIRVFSRRQTETPEAYAPPFNRIVAEIIGCDRKCGSTTPQRFDCRKPFCQPPILQG